MPLVAAPEHPNGYLSIVYTRDWAPNRYMMLINFKDQQSTNMFYEEFNGKSYNSADVSLCRMAWNFGLLSQGWTRLKNVTLYMLSELNLPPIQKYPNFLQTRAICWNYQPVQFVWRGWTLL
jgi:hypothetical protein